MHHARTHTQEKPVKVGYIYIYLPNASGMAFPRKSIEFGVLFLFYFSVGNYSRHITTTWKLELFDVCTEGFWSVETIDNCARLIWNSLRSRDALKLIVISVTQRNSRQRLHVTYKNECEHFSGKKKKERKRKARHLYGALIGLLFISGTCPII